MNLPDHYLPRWSRDEYRAHANLATDHVEHEFGYRVVAAGVTGSSLRGVWTDTSDVDTLILVDDTLRKARTFKADNIEGQIQSVYRWAEIISTSVPYYELQQSPWTEVATQWEPFFRGITVNWVEFQFHLENYARHLIRRPAVNPTKTARVLCCLHHLNTTGSPLCPRVYVDPGGRYPQIAEWVRSMHPDTDPQVLDQIGPTE